MSKTKVKKKKETKFSLFLKNNKYILISALIAFAVMQLVYFCFSLIPYGDMTILRMDLYHQYGPLFAELYDRLTSGESLIYSWNSGLGSSFLGNFYNYLSSPVTLLILFFGHKNIPEAIAAMIAVKAMLSAGSFTYYIKNHSEGTTRQRRHSVFYMLSAAILWLTTGILCGLTPWFFSP